MINIELKFTNKQLREWDYLLGKRYGKKKQFKTKLEIAVLEVVAMQARKEVKEAEKKL